MRTRRAVVAAGTVAGVALGSGMLAAAPADTADWADPCGMLGTAKVVSCFSDPLADPDTSSRILRSLGALVESARPGDSIKIMMFHWRNGDWPERLATEVAAAHAEGVDVQVMLDEQSEGYRPIDILSDAGVPLRVCRDGAEAADGHDDCLMDEGSYGDGSHLPMNHVKLFLFDLAGVPTVAAGSSNMTAWDYETAWNDFVRVRGDQRLHGFYTDVFERVLADDWMGWDSNADRDRSGDPVSDPADLPERGWIYPRIAPGDPIVGQLANTTACHTDGDGDGDGDSRVWVAISIWNENVRTGILDHLGRLDGAGCDVRVLVGAGIDRTWLRTIRQRLSGDPSASDQVRVVCALHHKFTLVDAEYGGAYREVVFTGSHIFAAGSLTNHTELSIRVGGGDDLDNGVSVDYADRFQRLYDHAPQDECG